MTAPIEPVVPPVESTPAVPPVVPPAEPKPFDVKDLSPEAQAYLRAQITAADSKARTTSKDNARTEVLDQIAQALGIKPKDVDPAEIGKQLVEARTAAAKLTVDRALDRAARAAGADEDLVGAVLERQGKLAGLDPTAADFADKVEALVTEAVAANPRLKLEATAPTPPGGQAPVAQGFGPAPAAGARQGFLAAVAKGMTGQR